MQNNNRLEEISEYHFKSIEEIKEKVEASGKEIIDLSIGDPDLPVNQKIIDSLTVNSGKIGFNRYPPYEGIRELKAEISEYYKKTYFVDLDDEEVIVLIGSKEGINNIIPAVCSIGDTVIIPELGYPVYETSSKLWGCKIHKVPLSENKNYLIDIEVIPQKVLNESKLFFVNYPNNPTGAAANEDFYRELINLCSKNKILLCNDGAYNEIYKVGQKPLSLLQVDKEKSCVEFGTFSKLYNMTGFRLGYAVGNKEALKALLKVKSNVDSGQFIPIQKCGIEALRLSSAYGNEIRNIYDVRRKAAEALLIKKNISFFEAEGTFYIWCKVPEDYSTKKFCEELLYEYGIAVTPGNSFGKSGEGYFRIALTKEKNIIENALNKLRKYKI